MGNAYRSVLSLKPTGDAVPANVLAGKTFSNADGTGKTGTMANNGAVSVTLTDQDPTYTIPEGYHNGSGIVGFSASGGDGADLIVTCSSAFAGATISCTDGTTTYQKICPSSSPFEVVFDSIPVGTWTISGTAEGVLFSTQFTVVNFETVLNSIPEGSTVTPTDNIQTWLHCANIWDKTYTTISQILADASTLQTLIASNNAVDYMVRSTSWSSAITANASAMSYIGLNDYCAATLLADTTWRTAICNSTYFESVLNTKVPTMTSDTTPSGVASASSVYTSDKEAFRVFDGNGNADVSTWISTTGSPQWIQYQFVDAVKIYIVKGERSENLGYNYPKGMTLKGSNNGTSFTTVGSYSTTDNSWKFTVNPISAYKYYRLEITSHNGTSGTHEVAIGTLQFYGRA